MQHSLLQMSDLSETQPYPEVRRSGFYTLTLRFGRNTALPRLYPKVWLSGFDKAHDASIGSTFQELIGYPLEEDHPFLAKAKHIAFLPIAHGGLGLRSMALIAPAENWAA